LFVQILSAAGSQLMYQCVFLPFFGIMQEKASVNDGVSCQNDADLLTALSVGQKKDLDERPFCNSKNDSIL